MRNRLYLVCLLLLGICLAGEATTPNCTLPATLMADTSLIEIVSVDSSLFESYYSDKDFIYSQIDKPIVTGFWDKIAYRILQFLNFMFKNNIASNILIFIIFIVFILLMIRLIGGDFQTLFSRNKAITNKISSFVADNIAETDFDALTDEEVSKDNLNMAVRFQYLKLLQTLSRQQLIDWQPDKTNRQYIQELLQQPFIEAFLNATKTYEYVWYGKFRITQPVFNDMRNQVNQLIKQVQSV
jgi:hypothetical protein